jgi:hypothetical protein
LTWIKHFERLPHGANDTRQTDVIPGTTDQKGVSMSGSSLNLTMLSPLAVYLDEASSGNALAPRPATLEGKVVGLLPNWRPSAAHILREVGKLLEERYKLKAVLMEQPVRELPIRTGKLLDTMRETLDGFAARVDVAITATGD